MSKFNVGDKVMVKETISVSEMRKFCGEICTVVSIGFNECRSTYVGHVVTVSHPTEGFLALYEEAFDEATHPLIGKTVIMRGSPSNTISAGKVFLGVVDSVNESNDIISGRKLNTHRDEGDAEFSCFMSKWEYTVLDIDSMKFTSEV